MKKLITIIFILFTFQSIGQITYASYTNKGATVPFINSSSYKLDGVTLDSANTVKRGFFTKYQYSYLHSLISSQWSNISGGIEYTLGKVKLGTDDYQFRFLEASGRVYFETGASYNQFTIYDVETGGGAGGPVFKVNGQAGSKYILLDSTNLGYNVGIGKSPLAKLSINGGVQIANDADAASVSKVGTMRYRVSGNNSYFEMCMQTAASTYEWVVIKTNAW